MSVFFPTMPTFNSELLDHTQVATNQQQEQVNQRENIPLPSVLKLISELKHLLLTVQS